MTKRKTKRKNPLPANFRGKDIGDYPEPLDMVDDAVLYINHAISNFGQGKDLYVGTKLAHAAKLLKGFVGRKWYGGGEGPRLINGCARVLSKLARQERYYPETFYEQMTWVVEGLYAFAEQQPYLGGRLATLKKLQRAYDKLRMI